MGATSQALTDLALYGYWRSSSSWRVRLALEIKGLAYDNRPVHLVRDGGEQHHADFHAKNPMQQVPVLEGRLGGAPFQISQSVAIMEMIEEVAPGPALLPPDPASRAQVRALTEVINSGIQPVQNLSVLQKVANELGGDKVAWAKWAIERGLLALEEMAQATAGRCLVGDAPTLADLCLIPQMYNARRFGVALSAMPTLARVDETLGATAPFQAAHPDAQPDAQR